MYEHAYHLEFSANASAYVDAFMRLIEWTAVTERLTQATAGGGGGLIEFRGGATKLRFGRRNFVAKLPRNSAPGYG